MSCKDKDQNHSTTSKGKISEPVIPEGITHGLILPPVTIFTSKDDSLVYNINLVNPENHQEMQLTGSLEELSFDLETTFPIEGRAFAFRQLHFHSPSLHYLEGLEFPLELHVVTGPKSSEWETEYAVISVLFSIGEENQFIDELLRQPPASAKEREEAELNTLLGARAMLNKTKLDLKGFYHYLGPLATEPYKRDVHWFIARRVFEVSEEQLMRIQELIRLQEN